MSARIPTLDIRRYDSDRAAFVAELGAAYREWGFAGIRGHGIAQSGTTLGAHACEVDGRGGCQDAWTHARATYRATSGPSRGEPWYGVLAALACSPAAGHAARHD